MRRRYYIRMGLLLFAVMLTVGCTPADSLSIEDIWARPGNHDANSAVYFVVANTTDEIDKLLSAESDIATAVEVHKSMMKPEDEGQGELAKPVEDEPHEHMEAHLHEAHHENGDMEYHEHEDGEHCEDHNEEFEHHDGHHESEDIGNTMESSMDTNLAGGVMMMVQQENVRVGAQSQLEFTPGGLHVMLIGLAQDLNPGDTFQVTLTFEKAGRITLDVPVREP